jgi:hypothetical protein
MFVEIAGRQGAGHGNFTTKRNAVDGIVRRKAHE